MVALYKVKWIARLRLIAGLASAFCILWMSQYALAKDRPLVFGGASFPPFFGEGMENDGPLVEIAREAFAVTGREISVKWLPWKRVIAMSKAGDLDGITFAWHNDEREAFLVFGEAIFSNENGLFRYKDSPVAELKNLSLLRGKRIGIVDGYALPESLLNVDVEFVRGNEDVNLLKMLSRGRLDYVYTDRQVGRYLIRTNAPDIQNKVVWFATLKTFPSYLAISKNIKNADIKNILDQWAKGLEALKTTGRYEAILRQYHLIDDIQP